MDRANVGRIAEELCELSKEQRAVRIALLGQSNAPLAQKLREWFAHFDRITDDPDYPLHWESDPFELGPEIARGANGIVYRAYHKRCARDVALKVMHTEGGQSALAQEAFAAGKLKHDRIATVFDAGMWRGRPYVCTQLIDGPNLDALRRRIEHGRLESRLVATIGVDLADAVAYAHAEGILHRDLKPANVVFSESKQRAVIVDFGAAISTTHGSDGRIVGTPAYMAPEVSASCTNSVSSDVYSIGATLFELLTGQLPKRGTERKVLEGVPPLPSAGSLPNFRKGVGRPLRAIVLKCLGSEPEKRYASAEDLAQELRLYLEGKPVKASRLWAVDAATQLSFASVRVILLTLFAASVLAMFIGSERAKSLYSISAKPAAVAETVGTSMGETSIVAYEHGKDAAEKAKVAAAATEAWLKNTLEPVIGTEAVSAGLEQARDGWRAIMNDWQRYRGPGSVHAEAEGYAASLAAHSGQDFLSTEILEETRKKFNLPSDWPNVPSAVLPAVPAATAGLPAIEGAASPTSEDFDPGRIMTLDELGEAFRAK